MDAEQVVDKILADAKAEAEKIKTEADNQTAGKKAKLDTQLAEYKKQSDALAKKSAEEKKAHMLAAARMDIAREYLAEKRAILDEVFKQAKLKLQNMDDNEYRKMMTKLMLEAIETGDEEVVVDNNEKRINPEFIKLVNRELGPGYKGNLRLSHETADIGAGFILKRGKIKNNVSLPVLLTQARKELETELAKELFS